MYSAVHKIQFQHKTGFTYPTDKCTQHTKPVGSTKRTQHSVYTGTLRQLTHLNRGQGQISVTQLDSHNIGPKTAAHQIRAGSKQTKLGQFDDPG